MTVCRRPVASWEPQGVGHSGLDRLEPENRCRSPPSDTGRLFDSNLEWNLLRGRAPIGPPASATPKGPQWTRIDYCGA
jgi:hypothetical protein